MYLQMDKTKKHIPQRSCVICRAKSSKDNLIRIVKDPENLLVVDTSKKLPGRGIYLCPDLECIEKAKKSHVPENILRASSNEIFWENLVENAKNFDENKNLKLRSILGLARKAGVLLIGSERIENSKERKILVLLADDCSEGVKNFLDSHREFQSIILDISMNELSEIIGSRGGVQILGLPLNSGFAKKILSLNL